MRSSHRSESKKISRKKYAIKVVFLLFQRPAYEQTPRVLNLLSSTYLSSLLY